MCAAFSDFLDPCKRCPIYIGIWKNGPFSWRIFFRLGYKRSKLWTGNLMNIRKWLLIRIILPILHINLWFLLLILMHLSFWHNLKIEKRKKIFSFRTTERRTNLRPTHMPVRRFATTVAHYYTASCIRALNAMVICMLSVFLSAELLILSSCADFNSYRMSTISLIH